MACPLLLVNDETAWGRADDAAAGGNVRAVAVAAAAAGENVRAQPSESAMVLAADGKVLADGGIPAYAV